MITIGIDFSIEVIIGGCVWVGGIGSIFFYVISRSINTRTLISR
jgi:predicted ABC-type sugar transport system permease subunit